MNTQALEPDLRKTVKKLLIDLNLDYKGSLLELAQKLEVNYNMLSMALTGYRKTPGSEKILKNLMELLYPNSNPEGGDPSDLQDTEKSGG